MDVIDPKQLREARDLFRELLTRKTKEAEWQQLFAMHPYVITPSLPLRLEPKDIIPMATPGKTEPDFIFYPQKASTIDFYGLIELKRHDQKIATVTRENVAILTRDAQTAVEQVKAYSRMLPNLLPVKLGAGQLIMGNERYLFVIMGTTNDLIFRPGNELYHEIVNDQLPENLRIIPYDVLLKKFENQYPPAVYFLVPERSEIPEGKLRLRATALTFSEDDVQKMLRKRNFYDRWQHWPGKGLRHEYERIERTGANVVIDHTTGLMWQQSGSPKPLTYSDAENYIRELNQQKFAGHDDWRLPTLEEAMSLMEPTRRAVSFFIDPLFDKTQREIRTADKDSMGLEWSVNFDLGYCNRRYSPYRFFIRVVR